MKARVELLVEVDFTDESPNVETLVIRDKKPDGIVWVRVPLNRVVDDAVLGRWLLGAIAGNIEVQKKGGQVV